MLQSFKAEIKPYGAKELSTAKNFRSFKKKKSKIFLKLPPPPQNTHTQRIIGT